MQNLKVLNKKEIKKISERISEQWGCDSELDYVFLLSQKNKIYIVTKDISRVDVEKLRINSAGIYFGEINERDELRLSIEGSQLIGRNAKKNVLELDEKQLGEWLNGQNVDVDSEADGFVILKSKGDFYGTGRISNKKLYNFVPKERRVKTLNLP